LKDADKLYLGGEDVPDKELLPQDITEFFKRFLRYLRWGREK